MLYLLKKSPENSFQSLYGKSPKTSLIASLLEIIRVHENPFLKNAKNNPFEIEKCFLYSLVIKSFLNLLTFSAIVFTFKVKFLGQ